MWKFLVRLISLALTGLLWYLQEMPSPAVEWYDIALEKHKVGCALTALVSVFLIEVIIAIITSIRKKRAIKRWSDSFLRHIIQEHLNGRNYQTRISILRPQKGWQIILQYIFLYPLYSFFSGHNHLRWKAYIKNVPLKLFADYLTIYARYGHSDQKLSFTHFFITDRQEGNNGLAVMCYKQELDKEVCTNCISSEILPDKYDVASESIKRYMRESFIDAKYYHTLLSMNTVANNMYAVPIFDENQHIWGVMMIDNDSTETIHYKGKLENNIAGYQKMFTYTLQILDK